MTTTVTQAPDRPDEIPDVTDPVLFLRMFEMLNDVGGELSHAELDAAARGRAAVLLTTARRRIRDCLTPDAAAELERVEPGLPTDPTLIEVRLAYRGVLAWLEGLTWFPGTKAPSADGPAT